MELIFEVREAEEGGYVAQAPGHSIFTEADSWEALRANAVEAASVHFEDASVRPNLIWLHFIKYEAIAIGPADLSRISAPNCWPAEIEPSLETDPELQDVLAELSSREPIFHRAEFGMTRADFERMTVEDYWETGASGRRYSRQFVLDELEKRFAAPHEDVWETSEFQCRRLGDDVYLLTYTLLQDHVRLTRRATVWRKTRYGWKIVYHQGTVVQDA